MHFTLRRSLGAASLMTALILTPAVQAEDLTITHAQGETAVAANPETVLTYDFAALDLLDALGIEIAGLPGSNLPPYLSKYASDDYLKVGSLFEPDYEAVNAAEPNLIIVAGRSAGAYEQLSQLAPTIDLTNSWADFAGSSISNAEIIGEIFGKQDEVAAMIAEFDAKVSTFQTASADLGTALIVLTSGGEVTAYGPGSRFGILHDTLGVTPAVEDVEAATHGEAISFEFILETNPDWLIVIDRDAAVGQDAEAAEQVLDNELVHQTTAWQQGQVVYVDPVRWYIVNGGLNNLNAMIDELSAAMLDG